MTWNPECDEGVAEQPSAEAQQIEPPFLKHAYYRASMRAEVVEDFSNLRYEEFFSSAQIATVKRVVDTKLELIRRELTTELVGANCRDCVTLCEIISTYDVSMCMQANSVWMKPMFLRV